MAVTGLQEVMMNLNAAIKDIENRTHEGIVAAGVFIQSESQELVPVDFGVLRDSSFTETVGPMKVTVGYTAEYAAAVHEMPMTLKGQPRADFGKTGNRSEFGPQQVVSFGGGSGKGTYWDTGENKFLEKAVKNNIPEILGVIHKRAKDA